MSKTIAIFGGGTGLGISTARRCGREGYQVALIGRRAHASPYRDSRNRCGVSRQLGHRSRVYCYPMRCGRRPPASASPFFRRWVEGGLN